MSLKDCLKRGALITAANWHVVVVQFVADALFKTLLAVPIVGGVFLAVLLIGGDPNELLSLPVTEIVPTMASVLMAQPLALAAFLLAMAVVLFGGSLLMFLVKGGTVTVLIAADRAAGAIEHPPLRLPAFRRATQFSLDQFTGGAARLFPRYVRLGLWLMVVYALSTVVSLAFVFGPRQDSGDWRMLAAVASLALVAWITVVNFFYLLFQVVIATDDVGVREAAGGVARLIRHDFRNVSLVFVATFVLVILTTAASILATTALGLIAFVPLVGLAALPLQLVAWLVRGLVFEFIALTALTAYLRMHRGLRDGYQQPGLAPDNTVHQISRTA
ncbi:MAG TPA: hypothetical protein VNJ02_12135 [Vicinamibacterales bacterium]|nr:hypothetical protein [Vicinamibacterales bacterium]